LKIPEKIKNNCSLFHSLTVRGLSSIDPDAKLREEKNLHEEDEIENQKIIDKLWEYIRCGDIEEAKVFCRKSKQFWRAATLSSCSLYHNSRLHPPVEQSEAIGNPNRSLAMNCLYQLSNDANFDRKERSVYGALCGNLKAMNFSCLTWYDAVWAHMKASTESQINEATCLDENTIFPGVQKETLKIFESIPNSLDSNIRQESIDPFHILQTYIIQNDFDGLISTVAKWSKDSGVSMYSNLFRFATHFVLFAMKTNTNTVNKNSRKFLDDKDTIIMKFIDHLIETKKVILSFFTLFTV
jgi:nuclear pore complex protein Nup107